jgi:hypothetical protein
VSLTKGIANYISGKGAGSQPEMGQGEKKESP